MTTSFTARARSRSPVTWSLGGGGLRVALALAVGSGVVGCSDESLGAPGPASELIERYGLEPLPSMVHPLDNQPSDDVIALGRLLFFDPIQSAERDVACATCHLPELGFGDGRDLPIGPSGEGLGPERRITDPAMVEEGRHSMSIINVGFNQFGAQSTDAGFMFWDGRRRQLENLVLLPQREFSEMRGEVYSIEVTIDTVLTRLRSVPEYETLFQQAFPDKAALVATGSLPTAVDSVGLARALAQFIRSVTSTDSPYDRFLAGDEDALDAAQKRGLEVFQGKGDCARCHSGPLLSDFNFHVVGAVQRGPGFQGTPHDDLGRWVATRLDKDRYAFRTPALRSVALTAPYMHSGGYDSLREVVEFFNRGGGDHALVNPNRLDIAPLGLSEQQVDDLVAFLESLTDDPGVATPERVPSGLDVPRLVP